MKNKINLKVGQTVFLMPMNNAARGGNKTIITDIITSVGNKYFSLKGKSRNKFSIETREEHVQYSSDYRVYFSEQEIQDEIDVANLRQALLLHKFTLVQLRYLDLQYNLLKK